jgi:hypothetical protein
VLEVYAFASIGSFLLLAVAAGSEEPKLGEIYNRSAQYHGPRRNPVILIPGILGSTLEKKETHEIIWGGFAHDYANPETPEGARAVALPMEPNVPLSRLKDNVVATGALNRIKLSLLGIPLELVAYRNILISLGVVGGYADETLGTSGAVNYGTDRWGLADPAAYAHLQILLPGVSDPAKRRAIALDHLRKCLRRAKQFQQALDLPARPPPGTKFYLVAGDAINTPSVVSVGRGGRVRVVKTAPGDETILRSSALMDERVGGKWSPELRGPIHWEQVSFIFKDHLALTKDVRFTNDLLFILLEKPKR